METEGEQLMGVCLKVILKVLLVVALLSGCVTPYQAKRDDSLRQNQFGREEVDYYRVKVSIPF